MSERILYVDDDVNVLKSVERSLRGRFNLDTALGPSDALVKVDKKDPYAVVVSDLRMPGMDGVELLSQIQQITPESVRIMLTGFADLETAMEAVNRGNVFRFLTKPCEPDELAIVLEAALKQYRLEKAEKEVLEQTLSGTMQILVDLLSMINSDVFRHSANLRELVRVLAGRLGIQNSWELEVAAMLLEIGHVTLPPDVVLKTRRNEPLSATEAEMIRNVPRIGSDLVKNIPRLGPVGATILYQSKHYDGSGYPDDNLSGQDIPIGSRILSILREYDHLLETGETVAAAFDEMVGQTGRFDPVILGRLRAAFLGEEAASLSARGKGESIHRPCAFLHVQDIATGMTLADDVRTKDGKLLIAAGHAVTSAILAKMQNYSDLVGLVEPIKIWK